MRSLATSLVTYTNTQAAELRDKHPGKRVTPAPNAIYAHREFGFEPGSTRNSIVYVGRMTYEKRILDVVEAFELIAGDFPDVELLMVGDGEALGEVRKRLMASSHTQRMSALGHVDDYASIRSIYARSVVSVSPGYVGLSITQSLTFGVPMIISVPEPHSPEIEAADWGINALSFESQNVADLARTMRNVLENRVHWAEKGDAISKNASAHYSAETMADGLIAALEEELSCA